MPGVFVTATGTEVGKTYVTAALLRAGRRAGIPMSALKPILTGYRGSDGGQSDAGLLLDALDLPVTSKAIAAMAPFRFGPPLAPNMAAKVEGRPFVFPAVVEACRAALQPDCLTLIEGIGGVMVPLDDRHTVLDLVATLDLPVILVSGSALGALSHCLTACEVLRARGRAPALIVLNESPASTVPLDATRDTLAAFAGGAPVVVCPRDAGLEIHDGLLASVLALPPLAALFASGDLRHKA